MSGFNILVVRLFPVQHRHCCYTPIHCRSKTEARSESGLGAYARHGARSVAPIGLKISFAGARGLIGVRGSITLNVT